MAKAASESSTAASMKLSVEFLETSARNLLCLCAMEKPSSGWRGKTATIQSTDGLLENGFISGKTIAHWP